MGNPPEATADLDLSDYTCLPGLINTHGNFDANPEGAADFDVNANKAEGSYGY